MEFLRQDAGCCGADFNKNNISYLGLLSFSFPAVLFLAPLMLIFRFLKTLKSPYFNKVFFAIEIIFNANKKLIQTMPILSKFKCQLSGSFFRFSPYFSGWIYKYFNYIIFAVVWFFLICMLLVVKNVV